MSERVVVTGMGVVTPVGQNVEEFWVGLKEGRCGIRPVEGVELDGVRNTVQAVAQAMRLRLIP